MHRIDTEFAVDGQFVDGNPGEGIPATTLSADYWNDLQGNVALAIENEGIPLVKGEYGQLSAAMGAAAGNRASFRNRIFNGDHQIWQRGNFFNNLAGGAGPTFTADRWLLEVQGSQTGVVQCSRDILELGELAAVGSNYTPRFYMSLRAFDNTSGDLIVRHRAEGLRGFAGARYQLSFYARSDTPLIAPFVARSNFGPGGSGTLSYSQTSIAIAGDGEWARYQVPVDVPQITSSQAIALGDHVEIELTIPGGQAFLAGIAAVQLELGAGASQFEARPVATELILCQRYFEKSYQPDASPGSGVRGVPGRDVGTALYSLERSFVVPKVFPDPTVTWYGIGGSADQIDVNGAGVNVTLQQGISDIRTGWPVIDAADTVAITDELSGNWTAEAEL